MEASSLLVATPHGTDRTIVLETKGGSDSISLIAATCPVSARPGTKFLNSLTIGLTESSGQDQVIAIEVYRFERPSRSWRFLLQITERDGAPWINLSLQWSPLVEFLVQPLPGGYLEVVIDEERYTTNQEAQPRDHADLPVNIIPVSQSDLLLRYIASKDFHDGQVTKGEIKGAATEHREEMKARESNPKLLNLIRTLGNLIKAQSRTISFCAQMFGRTLPSASVVEYDQADFGQDMDRLAVDYGKKIEEIDLFLESAQNHLTIWDLKNALRQIREALQLRFFWRRDQAIRDILNGLLDPIEVAIARKVERI